jgi:hypothetical protein
LPWCEWAIKLCLHCGKNCTKLMGSNEQKKIFAYLKPANLTHVLIMQTLFLFFTTH